jgi:non-ribosomal peptide synthetase component F
MRDTVHIIRRPRIVRRHTREPRQDPAASIPSCLRNVSIAWATLSPDTGGYLEYISRIDAQVKILDQRVELAAIESALNRQPSVATWWSCCAWS